MRFSASKRSPLFEIRQTSDSLYPGMADGMAPQGNATPPQLATELQQCVRRLVLLRAAVRKHGVHPFYSKHVFKDSVYNTSDHHVGKYPAVYAEVISKDVTCTPDEFAVAFKSANADHAKTRAVALGKGRALKSDMLDAANMWNCRSVSDLHRFFLELVQLRKRPALLPPLPRDKDAAMGSLLELTDKLNKRDAERQSRDEQRERDFGDRVEAVAEACIPGIKRDYERRERQLDERERQLDARDTKLDKRQAAIQEEEEDPGKIEKLEKKNEKQNWEIMELSNTVKQFERKAQLAKQRQKGRAEEKRRGTLFNSHTATHTPESATKRIAKRTRR